MIESKLEKDSLVDALNYCRASNLPEPIPDGDKRIWVKGLAKVHKSDCSCNWAVVRNDGYSEPMVVKDYGNCAMIVRIDEVHPLYFLDMSEIPLLRSKTDILNYLKNHGENEDEIKQMLDTKDKSDEQAEKDKADVKAKIIQYAIEDLDFRNSMLMKEEEKREKIEKKKNGKKSIKKSDEKGDE